MHTISQAHFQHLALARVHFLFAEMDTARSPKRHRLTDYFTKLPSTAEPQYFPACLRRYEPVDILRRPSRPVERPRRCTEITSKQASGSSEQASGSGEQASGSGGQASGSKESNLDVSQSCSHGVRKQHKDHQLFPNSPKTLDDKSPGRPRMIHETEVVVTASRLTWHDK